MSYIRRNVWDHGPFLSRFTVVHLEHPHSNSVSEKLSFASSNLVLLGNSPGETALDT
jgi:hypothetical protein